MRVMSSCWRPRRGLGAGGPGGLFAEMYVRARGDLPIRTRGGEFATGR